MTDQVTAFSASILKQLVSDVPFAWFLGNEARQDRETASKHLQRCKIKLEAGVDALKIAMRSGAKINDLGFDDYSGSVFVQTLLALYSEDTKYIEELSQRIESAEDDEKILLLEEKSQAYLWFKKEQR